MRFRQFALIACLVAAAIAQTPAGPPIIRTETRVVLVDAVVTDKSGAAVKGLTAKDFHVFEDNKEQPVQSASYVADATGPDAQRSYLVLFFDNGTLDFASQQRAREAAVQFIEANAGPTHSMAVANYGGALSIAQNFTTDTDKLKRVASDIHGGSQVEALNVDPTVTTFGSGSQSRGMATSTFGAQGFLLGLRQLALNLANVPGRKSVIVFSSGFPMTPDLNVQVNLAVQACNRSDLALYPVDVTGLSQPASNTSFDSEVASSGGLGRGAANSKQNTMHPTDTPTNTADATQQVLFTMATATGGFVYANANNISAGLLKIGKEQTEYYLLGYTPAESPDGSCHPLKVKVDKGGTTVRSRVSYCNVKSQDLLAGKPVEQELERRMAGSDNGKITAAMQVPYFYPDADESRLNVAVDIPSKSISFDKSKGKSHAEVNIVGIAYKPDGAVGARFSDAVKLDFATPKDLDAFYAKPLHYEKQFLVAPGKYNFKLAFNAGGDSFGKLEVPLEIDPYDGKSFMLSGLALSKEVHPAAETGTSQDAELMEGRVPLVYKDVKIVPAGGAVFAKTDTVMVYGEVYEPLLTTDKPPVVELRMRIVDKKTDAPKTTGAMRPEIVPNSPTTTLPFALKLKVDALPPGLYRVDVEAVDSTGKDLMHAAEFEIR